LKVTPTGDLPLGAHLTFWHPECVRPARLARPAPQIDFDSLLCEILK
jgi:hypothetical protein